MRTSHSHRLLATNGLGAPTRRGLLAAGTGTIVALALGGCASVLAPRRVDISREELLARLADRFPMGKQVLGVLDITAAAPRLHMLPEDNRMAAEFDLQARDRLFGKRHEGRIALSFGLRFERSDLTLRLAQVKVDRLHFAGLPPGLDSQLTRIGAWLAEDHLQDLPIHRFRPEDLRGADRLGLQVDDIRVRRDGLSVHLAPRP